MSAPSITPKQLTALFWYDAIDGVLIRRVSVGNGGRFQEGEIVGSKNKQGYLVVSAHGVRLLAHRVAFAISYGEWPIGLIDHIDGNRLNNRLLNLRDVTPSENNQNQRRAHGNSASGLLGVSPQRGRWKAEIKVDGKKVWLGAFGTAEEAHQSYMNAKRRLHISTEAA